MLAGKQSTCPSWVIILIESASGGVGSAGAQLAHTFKMDLTMFGACSPSKFDYPKSPGVTPIDRHSKEKARVIRDATGGAGVDVAYDAVGSKESLDISAATVKEGTGRVVCIGMMSSIAPDGSKMLPSDFQRSRLSLVPSDHVPLLPSIWIITSPSNIYFSRISERSPKRFAKEN